MDGLDRALAALAGVQLGNITHAQLLEVGVGPRAIEKWIARGRLIPRHRGVYALAHLSLPPFSQEMAAVLAIGEDAVLSHASAAYVYGLTPAPTGPAEVTIIGRHVRPRKGIRVHHTRALDSPDVSRKGPIPITSPARTIIDNAPELRAHELELVLNEALVIGLPRPLISPGSGEVEAGFLLARTKARGRGGRRRLPQHAAAD